MTGLSEASARENIESGSVSNPTIGVNPPKSGIVNEDQMNRESVRPVRSKAEERFPGMPVRRLGKEVAADVPEDNRTAAETEEPIDPSDEKSSAIKQYVVDTFSSRPVEKLKAWPALRIPDISLHRTIRGANSSKKVQTPDHTQAGFWQGAWICTVGREESVEGRGRAWLNPQSPITAGVAVAGSQIASKTQDIAGLAVAGSQITLETQEEQEEWETKIEPPKEREIAKNK
ncbi:MAG: hypothetical protein ABW032_04400, partial [Burkholderiaceae bacterium]